MKRKYLLRGIGIGLIIGVCVTYTAFKTGDYGEAKSSTSTEAVQNPDEDTKKAEEAKKASEEAAKKAEEEAKKKAEAEKKEEEAKKASEEAKKAEEEAKKKAEEEKKEKEAKKKASEEAGKTEEKTEKKTEKKTEEKTEKKTEEKTEKKSEATTEKKEDPSGEAVEVTIERGMTSEKIARKLQEAGIVESASDFDSWLKRKRYSNKLHVGTFTLTEKMNIEEGKDIMIPEIVYFDHHGDESKDEYGCYWLEEGEELTLRIGILCNEGLDPENEMILRIKDIHGDHKDHVVKLGKLPYEQPGTEMR